MHVCVWVYLAGSFVGAHLQADGGLVIGFLCLRFGVVKVSPGPVGGHTSLACAFVGSHLKQESETIQKWVKTPQEMIYLEFSPMNLVLQSTFIFRNHFQKHVCTDIG